MKKFSAALAICGLFLVANVNADVVGEYPDGGGPITISADPPVQAAGLDFNSAGSFLTPIPPGNLTAPAAPFTFLLANNAKQVTFGNLGSAVEIGAPLTLAVGYTGPGGGDLTASWGNGPTPVSFSVAAAGGGPPAIPEPATGLLAIVGALGALGFRRRR